MIAELRVLQRRRVFCIRMQQRIDRATEALIYRDALGGGNQLAEAERKKLFGEAAKIRRSVEKGGALFLFGPQAGDVAPFIPLIVAGAQARAAFDAQRAVVEAEMRRLARATPGHQFAASVRGFGELALAIVIGEAGDLAGYATPAKLWKRLGLAVIAGERQQKKTGAEAAALHGYSPSRRAEIYAALGLPLFFAQTAAQGEYRGLYEARRLHTAQTHQDWSKGHSHNDALRYITKRALRDLWSAWRRAKTSVEPNSTMPGAEIEAVAHHETGAP